MKGLTETQKHILDFIKNFIEKHHHSPSYREIMEHFSFSSPGTVYKHIHTLQRKGALLAEKGCSRSLALPQHLNGTTIQSEFKLPFIGHIVAGFPIELFIQPQMIEVPKFLVQHPDSTYLLRAQGDSLQDELIADGDLIIVEARQEAQAGETVIALLNQHDVIVSRYFPEGHYIRLESCHAQSKHLTVRYDNLVIQGVITGVIRTY